MNAAAPEPVVDVSADSDFSLANLPYGIVERDGSARVAVALGEYVVDLLETARIGRFKSALADARDLFDQPALNALLRAGRPVWSAVRARLQALLTRGPGALNDDELALVTIPRAGAVMRMPFAIGDYVDFYSSLYHAENMGKIFRPGSEPLTPNWRHLPIGYHGRTGSIVPGGTDIVRPCGQMKAPEAARPSFGPSRSLDFELELGFVTCDGPPLGEAIPIERAAEMLFGLVLVNDWSARDIQAWESAPLGPFLGKSFATSISPWVVTFDALGPYRTAVPRQEPPPLDHLVFRRDANYDIRLDILLQSATMREHGLPAHAISTSNAKYLYWTFAQQLAHAASNGATVRAGDLFASGTISGPQPKSAGSMLELSWRGAHQLVLPDGTWRSFLHDGDSVTFRGFAGGGAQPRVGFGELTGTVLPAHVAPPDDRHD